MRSCWMLLLGSLTVAVLCTTTFSDAAGAPRAAAPRIKAVNWPNNPLRHLLKKRTGAETPSFAANIRGGVALAGNTVETCSQNLDANPNLKGKRSKGKGSKAKAAALDEPCKDNYNNGLDMEYVNVNPGGGRFNSSTATLTVPTGAKAVKAFLYWAGDLSQGVSNGGGRTGHAAPGGDTPLGRVPHQEDKPHKINSDYGTVGFRVGGAGSYSTINAFDQGQNQSRWDSVSSWYSVSPENHPPDGQDPGWAYQVRADVTTQFNNALQTRAARRPARAAAGDMSVPITVANVQSGTGNNRYAGWNLIVVWSTPTAAFRDITLFDGFDFVQVQGGQQLVVGPLDFTGFKTPHSGDLDAHVTVWATEGDDGITGDYMSLGDQTTDCTTLKKQSDAAHPVDNFFNSRISDAGKSTAGRTPGFENQLGFDMATLALPEGTIGHDQTGASVCLGTTGDTYFFGGLVFDTLIQAPNLHINKDVDKSTAAPGDTVTYTTKVSNPQRAANDPLGPTATATNVVVADPLPSGIDFVQFTVNPGGVCSYDDAVRLISCDVGDLGPDATFSFAWQGIVNAGGQGDASSTLINTACFTANSADLGAERFYGCDDVPIIVPPAPKRADLGVVKSVDKRVVRPGGTLTWTVIGTNYGPAISTGFVLADRLPPGVQFVHETHDPALTCTDPAVGASGVIRCTAPSVPATPADGSSLTLTIVARVPASTPNFTLLLNLTAVSGDQPEPTPDPHPNRDLALSLVLKPHTPVPPIPPPTPPNPPAPPTPDGPPAPPAPPKPQPDIPPGAAGTRIALRKTSSPSVVRAGETISYTLRVSNIGEAAALQVRVCDTPPPGVTITSAPGFTSSGHSMCITIPKLQIGAHRTYHVTADVSSGTRGRVINHATATAANAPSARSKAPTTVVASPTVTG